MSGASGGTEPTAGLKHSVCVHQSHCGPAMTFLLHGILSQASSQESGFQEKASRDHQPSRLPLPLVAQVLMGQNQGGEKEKTSPPDVGWELSLSIAVHMANALTSYLIVSE